MKESKGSETLASLPVPSQWQSDLELDSPESVISDMDGRKVMRQGEGETLILTTGYSISTPDAKRALKCAELEAWSVATGKVLSDPNPAVDVKGLCLDVLDSLRESDDGDEEGNGDGTYSDLIFSQSIDKPEGNYSYWGTVTYSEAEGMVLYADMAYSPSV